MKNIPMLDLKLEYEYMKNDIDSAIKKCLDHQQWIFGPEIKEVEEKIADYIGVDHGIGCSSGTDALVLSLRALAIKLKGKEYFDKNDEIITTPFTFTATGDSIVRAGATPVFVDISTHTYNIDSKKIRDYLTAGKSQQVVGILPVHLYGQSCEMNDILGIAKEYNLFVLEDVAQAFGATWKKKKLGSLGVIGAFSFFPSKNLGGFGDGGMISTNDAEIAEIIRMLIKHGGKDKYNVDHIGYNARLDTLQAAILSAKFKYIDEFNERRRVIAKQYAEGLSKIEEINLPFYCTGEKTFTNSSYSHQNEHVFHQYTIRTKRRDELQKYLKEKGISTMIYYPFPLHRMKVFEDRVIIPEKLINAENFPKEVLSIPIEPLQKLEDTMYVVDCIKNFFKN